jgi:hypothetical protein
MHRKKIKKKDMTFARVAISLPPPITVKNAVALCQQK